MQHFKWVEKRRRHQSHGAGILFKHLLSVQVKVGTTGELQNLSEISWFGLHDVFVLCSGFCVVLIEGKSPLKKLD